MGCILSPLLSPTSLWPSLDQSLPFCSLDMQLTNCQLRCDSEVILILDFDPYWICSGFACHLLNCQSSACTVYRFGCLEEISAEQKSRVFNNLQHCNTLNKTLVGCWSGVGRMFAIGVRIMVGYGDVFLPAKFDAWMDCATVLGMLLENGWAAYFRLCSAQPHHDRSWPFCSLDMQLTNCQLPFESQTMLSNHQTLVPQHVIRKAFWGAHLSLFFSMNNHFVRGNEILHWNHVSETSPNELPNGDWPKILHQVAQ